MGAVPGVGECGGCELPAREEHFYSSGWLCVCTKLPRACQGAAVPTLARPNPTMQPSPSPGGLQAELYSRGYRAAPCPRA